jgi:hypothetical protein
MNLVEAVNAGKYCWRLLQVPLHHFCGRKYFISCENKLFVADDLWRRKLRTVGPLFQLADLRPDWVISVCDLAHVWLVYVGLTLELTRG